MSVQQNLPAAAAPVAYWVDSNGVECALDYIAQSEVMPGWTRARFVDRRRGVAFVKSAQVIARTDAALHRFAVTLGYGADGLVTIETVARSAEIAEQIVCAAEYAPRRSVVRVCQVHS